MKLKTLITTAVTTVLSAAIVLPAQASDGTISFSGSITATTCTITVTGGGAAAGATATVNMQAGKVADLDAAGKTAGSTDFNVNLSSCTVANGLTQGVAVNFESGANVNANGHLSNTGTATGVDLAIYPRGSTTALKLGDAPVSSTRNIAGGSVSLPYTVKYLRTAGAVAAGTVRSNVTYSIAYF
ncbi:type 1 fimbrial protein [Pseudomonas sp. PDM32]|uniref:fimbrial protein n=1 Tax=Pseudomonas sp. PDM32 TaxID=2854768 RepID=UPI001C44C1FC|nr:fimbrial protein [Pseudomonas sp. PDM32]MBV7576692.1 type 1 fimbrial protein [Pseudomonas sp. PDM32]